MLVVLIIELVVHDETNSERRIVLLWSIKEQMSEFARKLNEKPLFMNEFHNKKMLIT